LEAYDSVIVITGIGDAYTLLPPVRWIVQVKRLVEMLRLSTRESAQISVVGIQPGSSVNILNAKADGTVDRWAQALNEVTEGFCSRQERVHYLAPPDAESGDLDDVDRLRFKSPAVYKAWAVDIARHVVPLFALSLAEAEGAADVPVAVQDGAHRLAALDALGLGGTAADPRFLPVVRRARALFQTQGAAFTVIGEDTLVTKAVLGFDRTVFPADQSFCVTTIASNGPFVVEDAWTDSRAVPDTPIRFYAGYPVAAPDGTRIGALCVFGTKPRSDASIDASFLRELAEDISSQLLTPAHEVTAPAA
jgi:GAF domain-containing protein